jgi:hypothetical protein
MVVQYSGSFGPNNNSNTLTCDPYKLEISLKCQHFDIHSHPPLAIRRLILVTGFSDLGSGICGNYYTAL